MQSRVLLITLLTLTNGFTKINYWKGREKNRDFDTALLPVIGETGHFNSASNYLICQKMDIILILGMPYT